MSRLLLSKLDVDVLVQLAMHGPAEASQWDALVEDADRFGAQLWSANHRAAAVPADPPPPSYVFSPVPVAVTAVEGLKQLAYFQYQSMGDQDTWAQDTLGSLLAQLRDRLITLLPDYSAAPWGWAADDLAVRAGRAHSGGITTSEDHPGVVALRESWHRAGLPLTIGDPDDATVRLLGDPRRILASGTHRPEGHYGFAPVVATLGDDGAAADALYAARVRDLQKHVGLGHDAHVYRFGNLIVTTKLLPTDDPAVGEAVGRGIANLGSPDAHWWSGAPPLQEVAGEVIATGVRLTDHTGGTHLENRAIFARTPTEVRSLLALIHDPVLRRRLEEVSTRTQTILLLRGVFDLAPDVSAKVYAEAGHAGISDDTEHRLILTAGHATSGTGSVVVLDRLPRTPHAVELQSPRLRVAMIGDRPPRISG